MKTSRKIIAALLALVMVVPLFTVAASAKSATRYRGKSLVVLGDSIAAGYGLTPGFGDMITETITMPHGEFVKDSWPTLIRDQYGFSKKTSKNLSRNMWRTDEFLRLLDPSFEKELCRPENTFDQYMSDYIMFPTEITKPGDIHSLKSEIKQDIKQADVLVFSLCSNDIMTASILTPLMLPFYQVFGRQAGYALATVEQKKLLYPETLEDWGKFAIGDLDYKDLENEVRVRTKQFYKNYDRLLKIIYRLNPDVEVYTMGMTYPFKGVKKTYFQKSTLLDPMNKWCIQDIRNYVTKKSPYARRVKYVECSNVGGRPFDTPIYDPVFLVEFLVHVHPDKAGHKQLARNVSAAMNR